MWTSVLLKTTFRRYENKKKHKQKNHLNCYQKQQRISCMWDKKRSKCLILVFFPRPPCSPSQRCKVYTQKCVLPATPPLSSHTLAQDGQTTEALTSDSMLLSLCFCFTTEYCIGFAWVLMLYVQPVIGIPYTDIPLAGEVIAVLC